ncbi:MAG: ABC transporter permease [Verrucomicrobiota bacterium]
MANGRARGSSIRQKISGRERTFLALTAWMAFLALWESLSRSGVVNAKLLPPPSQVVETLVELIVHRGFLVDVWKSVERILKSYGIALAIALPLGIVMGCFARWEAFANALVSPFRYLPAPSFVPLLLMWLGTGDEQKIALLVLGVVWFLATLFMDNTKQVPIELIEAAQTMGARARHVVTRVVLPSALPSYVDTARQMLAVSWTYLVIAEIVAATDGIGAMMMRAKRFVRVDEIMAGILVIGILGFCFDALLRALHRRLFAYAHEANST